MSERMFQEKATPLSREALIRYQQQWALVDDAVKQERHSETVAERWKKLNALLQISSAMGLMRTETDTARPLESRNWLRLYVIVGNDALEEQP